MYGGKENDSYYTSLTKIYDSGGFSEQPSLFVRAQEAFLLYKEKDNINVMKRLKLDVEKGMARYKTKKKKGKSEI